MKSYGNIEVGKEVLIFNSYDDMHFIKGVITGKQEYSIPLRNKKGDSFCVIIHTAIGEDGKEYRGVYGDKYKWMVYDECYFRSKEEYLEYLDKKVSDNSLQIIQLENKNAYLLNIYESLRHEDTYSNKLTKNK